MGIHTIHTKKTFTEWICNLCNEKYVPTGGSQKYCKQCQKVMLKEYERRNAKRKRRRKKIRNALENLIRALDIKPDDNFQVRVENGRITFTSLPPQQPNQ